MNEIESKMPTESNYEGKSVKRKFGLRYTTVKESTLSLNCAERSLNLPGRSLFKYSIRSTDGAQESQQLCDCVCSVLLHHSYQKQSTGRNISEKVSCEIQLVRVWLSQGRRQTGKRMGSKHLHETRIPQRWQRNCSYHSFSPFQHCYTYPATRTFDILQKHFIQTSQLNVFLPYVRLQSGLCVTHGW